VGVAVIFPGQGTQVPRMGVPWRDTASWTLVERAEAALDRPLAPLLLDRDATLDRTEDAQLAVLLASLLGWEAVRHRIDAPVAFAGHSLGQITALIASGALGLDDGVRLAAARARCTQAAGARHPGRLAALIGAGLEQAEEACAGSGSGAERTCWVANDNAPGQVVVGGTPDGVDAAGERARQLGVKRVVPLNVAAAFHTPLLEDARTGLVPTLASTSFGAPSAPVVSNVDARPHIDADGWRDGLGVHLVSTVRWRESMQALVALGADTFLEVGPGSVLSGLARRTVPDVATRTVATPDEVPDMQEMAH
jgi:[acyl-carrier-protein] S-malonyltransferase